MDGLWNRVEHWVNYPNPSDMSFSRPDLKLLPSSSNVREAQCRSESICISSVQCHSRTNETLRLMRGGFGITHVSLILS